jgi:cytochrome c6
MKKLLTSLIFLALIIACSGKEKPTPVSDTPSVADGEQVYKRYCILCHGADGKLGVNGAKDITVSKLTLEERELQIKKGKNTMTPFEGILTETQMKSAAMYSMTLK